DESQRIQYRCDADIVDSAIHQYEVYGLRRVRKCVALFDDGGAGRWHLSWLRATTCSKSSDHGAGMRQAFQTDASRMCRPQRISHHGIIFLLFKQALTPGDGVAECNDSKASHVAPSVAPALSLPHRLIIVFPIHLLTANSAGGHLS